MKKNNEQIHIHHQFIESDLTTFAALYDISLVRFMIQYKFDHFGDFDHNIDPQQIEEIEKEFIRTTLDVLKHRNSEFRIMLDKIFLQFLEENKLTHAEFIEGWDNGIGEKFDDYQLEQLPKKEYDQDISFRMKINFLLVKANKIGCLIDLKEDFKFDEPIDYNAEPDSYFNAKGSEKLIYLKETGIIDFLKEQNPDVSENKLAKLLSILTGEKFLQSGLNSMESNSQIINRKNPYYSPKTAPKVQDLLTQWGFKIKNSN